MNNSIEISQDGLTAGPWTANGMDGVLYIKTQSPATLTLYYGILPAGEKMAKLDKTLEVDDTDDEKRGVIIIGGIVPGTRLKVVSTEPIQQAEFLQTLK